MADQSQITGGNREEPKESDPRIWDFINERLFELYLHSLVTTRQEGLEKKINKLFPNGVVFHRDKATGGWKTDDPQFNENMIEIAESYMNLSLTNMKGEMNDLWKAWDQAWERAGAEKKPELYQGFHEQVVLQALRQREQFIRREFDLMFPPSVTTAIQKGILYRKKIQLEEDSCVRAETRAVEAYLSTESPQPTASEGQTSHKGQAPAVPQSALPSDSTGGAGQQPRPLINREDFVKPILEKKGWSLGDLASKAVVDYNTVDDYLKGKTNPFPSTRKKFADALGVSVEELPQ